MGRHFWRRHPAHYRVPAREVIVVTPSFHDPVGRRKGEREFEGRRRHVCGSAKTVRHAVRLGNPRLAVDVFLKGVPEETTTTRPTVGRKAGPVPKFARNQTDLGRYLMPPRDRKIIQRAMKLEGCPGRTPDGRYEIAPWQSFINSKFSENVRSGDVDKTRLERERLELQNAQLRFKLQVMQREYSRNDDVAAWVGSMVGRAKMLLQKLPSAMAPIVMGLDPAEAEQRLQEQVDSVLQALTERPLLNGNELAAASSSLGTDENPQQIAAEG